MAGLLRSRNVLRKSNLIRSKEITVSVLWLNCSFVITALETEQLSQLQLYGQCNFWHTKAFNVDIPLMGKQRADTCKMGKKEEEAEEAVDKVSKQISIFFLLLRCKSSTANMERKP